MLLHLLTLLKTKYPSSIVGVQSEGGEGGEDGRAAERRHLPRAAGGARHRILPHQ